MQKPSSGTAISVLLYALKKMIEQPPKIPDLQLLHLLEKERTTAFEIIYEHYWTSLCSYASRFIEDPAICEDFVQEVLISLWERPSYLGIRNLKAYLFTSVKYKIYNYYQRRVLQLVHEDQLPDLPSEEISQEKELEYREFETRLLREIKQLPPRCRKVFLMSRFDSQSNSEIAIRLNISIRTVESHISTALKILRSKPFLNFFFPKL